MNEGVGVFHNTRTGCMQFSSSPSPPLHLMIISEAAWLWLMDRKDVNCKQFNGNTECAVILKVIIHSVIRNQNTRRRRQGSR